MVSMATHSEFENGGTPTKGLVCVLACSAVTSSARRRNAIQMAVRWSADGGPLLDVN